MIDLGEKIFTDFASLKDNFKEAKPFPYIVIDNFLNLELARHLDSEFPSLDSDLWYKYKNAIEDKMTYNHWESFPKNTYQVFSYLNSKFFIDKLNKLMPDTELLPDVGLNGGGWHAHPPGGKLNAHLDYSMHPKLMMERRLNIILYINEKYDPKWGGSLGLWSHDSKEKQPKDLIKSIDPIFNRAVVFDTTCNSWHGLPNKITCPENESRRSLAIYYLSKPREDISKREKALFAPTILQKNDKKILELIKKRSQTKSSINVYNEEEDKQ